MTALQSQISEKEVNILPNIMIEVENVVAGYRDNIVWENANFSIGKGEFAAVIGPNGAGKTTLFRLLLGLQQPISGTVRVLGNRPKRGNPRIGYVPQQHKIDSEMTIEALELVSLGVSGKEWGLTLFSDKDRKTALEALEAVGGSKLAHRSLNGLSGGELQKIFLAEALVSNPNILLLDEPLTGLDIKAEQELLYLVNTIVRARNVCALIVAHDINPLLPFLDKIVYVANGKIANGTPKEVLTTESLSSLYGSHVEVLRDSSGNVAIIGIHQSHEKMKQEHDE
jgi:zinc/manganese transport system ATP-binding protein